MVLHPLFSYPAILLALFTFGFYILALLKLKSLMRVALFANGLLMVLALLSVIFGFGVSNVPLVQSKTPGIWSFPHKWNGIMLFLISVVNFLIFWFKGETAGRKLVVLPLLGLLLTLFQLLTGWMLRLVFFS
ncbi:MAG: hypothetical protein RMH93_03235 [Aquificaceae bacterium]|nr:hypothetical protein [Aquificaceae bacterium]MDW8032542.1 hypothetical protein [Aquificaceae bacterium]